MCVQAAVQIAAAQSIRTMHHDPFLDPTNPPVPTHQNTAPAPVTPARRHGCHVALAIPDPTAFNVSLHPHSVDNTLHETPTRTSSTPLSPPALPSSSHASAPSHGMNIQSEHEDFTYVFQTPVTPTSSRAPTTVAVTPLRTNGRHDHTPHTPPHTSCWAPQYYILSPCW